jgi:hypothetical protein
MQISMSLQRAERTPDNMKMISWIRPTSFSLPRRWAATILTLPSEHVSKKIVLCSPIFDDTFVGKVEVRRVIQAVKSVIDATARAGIAEGEDRVVTFNTIRLGGATADAVDVIQVDADGLIDRITVMWRPLRAVLEGQNRLADLLGRDKLG